MNDTRFKEALAKFIDVKMWDEAQKDAKARHKETDKEEKAKLGELQSEENHLTHFAYQV